MFKVFVFSNFWNWYLTNQENEMSADQQAFQVAMSALQEAEEEVVDLHGQYFAHRDKMDKMLIPLYQMTNEVDYDVDGK